MNGSKKLSLHPGQEKKIKAFLNTKGFSFSDHEHAFWRAQKNGLTVVFYRKGTLFFQGDMAETDILLHLMNLDEDHENRINPAETELGLDESGKGDCFGPLVLAGALVNNKIFGELKFAGVMDSKKLSDSAIKRIYPEIMNKTMVYERVIEPEEYNRLYSEYGNLNLLMVEEYKKLIGSFSAERYDRVILDKFSQSGSQNHEIKKAARSEMIIIEKAESNLSVAAASVAARYRFISWLEKAGINEGLTLPKGSSTASKELFFRLKNQMNPEKFRRIAKTHFFGSNENLF